MLSDGALGKFSDRVRAGDIAPGSWLIAEKTDRLSRQGWEVLFDWLREMTRKGLNIITLDGHVFTAKTLRDQISVIKILLGGEADQQFSAKISERVQDAYVAAVNRVGREGRLEFWGGSFVAEPEGRVLDQASHDREEVRVVDCDRNRITKTRHLWPFLRDRRIDAYGGILKRWAS